MDDGPREIEDAQEVRMLKARAARIHWKAVIGAAVATAISLAI